MFLFAFAWQLVGGGHGSYLPLNVFSAPLGLFAPAAGLGGVLVLWLGVGIGISLAERASVWNALVGVLSVHYLGVGYAVWLEAQEGWHYTADVFETHPVLLLASFGTYLVGQIGIWIVLWRLRARRADAPS